MIIVGTYPEIDGSIEYGSPLQRLRRAVDELLSPEVILHLLPPYPASGDGGFAADDWFSVQADLGTWHELTDWASSRKLILDGIYNHVGFAHPWAVEFFASPREDGPFYAYRHFEPPSSNLSPRGGSVFRRHKIGEDFWYIWQTFSNVSFDVRLSDPIVYAEICRHLDFLADSGIYGVRLDGCAYYGHDLDVDQFHSPAGRELARLLAREATNRGLFVVAQLDADPLGASYFPKKEGWFVPVIDYAYSAVLVRAILSESASAMEIHVQRTLHLPCDVIRPPRTHDGILLMSDLLSNNEYLDLKRICSQWNLPVRIVEGESYEINSSLPFICSLGVDEQQTWQRILLILVLTGFLPGIPYFYLPFALCDIPETRSTEFDSDPRSLNRTRLHMKYINEFLGSQKNHELRAVFSLIKKIRSSYPSDNFNTAVLPSDDRDSVFLMTRDSGNCLFACNFSTTHSASLQLPKKMKLLWGSYASSQILDPLGFGIWILDSL